VRVRNRHGVVDAAKDTFIRPRIAKRLAAEDVVARCDFDTNDTSADEDDGAGNE
jgi:hypothetical protein